MDEWTAFLSARLDEDEAAAEAARAVCTEWYIACDDDSVTISALREHVGRHSPARALREVADGRRLLRQHEEFRAEAEAQRTAKGDVGSGVWSAFRVLSDTIRSRAAVWSDHPDYPGGRQDGAEVTATGSPGSAPSSPRA